MTEYGEQWGDLLAMYFGVNLPDDEITAWWKEIQRDFKGADNAELCRAVRWGSDDRNWKRKRRPDLSDLRIWMGINRKDARERHSPDQEGCELCTHGFVEYYPDFEGPLSRQDRIVAYCCHVPCGCPLGRTAMERVLAHGPQEDLEGRRRNLDEMFQAARGQHGPMVEEDEIEEVGTI
ncbi:MAG: hypothetical protein QGI09_05015 [Dehalococcoidia bacterium]|nr:hypothetical protein [Dehalococcoidia bacterium]